MILILLLPSILFSADCSGAALDPAIIGGTKVKLGEIPWQVSLQLQNQHFCGGTILTQDWILTAAHCKEGVDVNQLTVVTGVINLLNPGSTSQKVSVSEFIDHDGYDGYPLKYDIALIRLATPLQFNEYVSALPLPPPALVPTGDGVVSGWGLTSENGQQSLDQLYKVALPIMTLEECVDYYGDGVNSKVLCAGFQEGMKDACTGDSGGPLTCSAAGQTAICGVVSSGIGCARENSPGIYTAVSPYLDWIKTNMS